MTIDQMLKEAAERHGLDPELLLAQARAESNLDRYAESPVGAIGVMQLMPATAEELGVADPWDPWQNIDGGARYLKKMLEMFDGDTALALAAYNAGPGNVDKYGGIPPFEETQNYVKKIMAEIADTYQPPIDLPEDTKPRVTEYETPEEPMNKYESEAWKHNDKTPLWRLLHMTGEAVEKLLSGKPSLGDIFHAIRLLVESAERIFTEPGSGKDKHKLVREAWKHFNEKFGLTKRADEAIKLPWYLEFLDDKIIKIIVDVMIFCIVQMLNFKGWGD